MRNTYILLTWILQNGLQPIHHAAQEGHEDILMILVNDFNVRPDAVTYVRKGILHILNTMVLYNAIKCHPTYIWCHYALTIDLETSIVINVT